MQRSDKIIWWKKTFSQIIVKPLLSWFFGHWSDFLEPAYFKVFLAKFLTSLSQISGSVVFLLFSRKSNNEIDRIVSSDWSSLRHQCATRTRNQLFTFSLGPLTVIMIMHIFILMFVVSCRIIHLCRNWKNESICIQ